MDNECHMSPSVYEGGMFVYIDEEIHNDTDQSLVQAPTKDEHFEFTGGRHV